MKLPAFTLTVLALLFVVGCGSIATSKLEPTRPANGTELTGVPYYLPKGTIHVDIAWSKETRLWDVKVTPVMEPDGAARYVLSRKINTLFDDNITIAVDSTGLLQSVDATSEDQTVASIGSLVTAVGNALSFAAGLNPVGPQKAGIAERSKKTSSANAFHYVVIPGKKIETWQHETDWLTAPTPEPDNTQPAQPPPNPTGPQPRKPYQYAWFEIKTTPLNQADVADFNASANNQLPTYSEGVVVRLAVPYTVSVTAHTFIGTDAPQVAEPPTVDNSSPQNQVVLLPDDTQQYFLKLTRTPLVKNQTKVVLQNGMFQSLQLVRPSVVAGIVGIPKTIIAALLPIPLQIRQSQTNNLQAIDNGLKAKKSIADGSK